MKRNSEIKSYLIIGLILILGAVLYLVFIKNGFLEVQNFTSSSINSLGGVALTSLTFLPGGLAVSYGYLKRNHQKNLLPNTLILGYAIALSLLIPLGIFNLLINGF